MSNSARKERTRGIMAIGSGEYQTRIDYAKFNVETEADRVQEWYDQWNGAATAQEALTGSAGGSKFRVIRSRPGELHLIAFEAWGEKAELVHFLDILSWGPHCERIDVRNTTNVSPDGVDVIYRYATQHAHGARNVTLYSSKAREKRDGRSSGGKGIAIGSHKSEYRASIYKRAGEPGAVEFQFKGDKVSKMISDVVYMVDRGEQDWVNDPWKQVMLLLYSRGWTELGRTMNVTQTDISRMAVGIDLTETTVEQRLTEAEKAFDALPAEVRNDFLFAIQHKMHFPE